MKATRIMTTAMLMIASVLVFAPKLRPQQTSSVQPSGLKQLYVPYWTVADGYQSIVQLHNNLINDAILVHPIILTTDGRQIKLSDVRLDALENASINIGKALADGGNERIQSGSAILQYERKYGGALGTEISVIQAARTLSYTITGTELGSSTDDLAAVFWLPSKTAHAYIALQNTSTAEISVSASLKSGETSRRFSSVNLEPLESRVIEVPVNTLLSDSRNSTKSGAIILSHQGPEGSLNTSGWIEDERTGYSTMMTFHDPVRHHGTQLFGTQILMGQQKDLLPSGRQINVDSYLVLFNASASQPMLPRADFVFENGGRISHVPLTVPTLKPLQSVEIDLSDLQNDGRVPRDVSIGALVINYAGPEGFLMGRVFGIADDATYGFYSALESYTPFAINEVYWTTEGDAVSLLTVTNFSDKTDDINIVMTYRGGTLAMPKISLQPYQSTTVNVRDVMNAGLLPATASFGGFRIFGTPSNTKIVVKEHVISEHMRMAAPFYGSGTYAVYLYLSKLTTGGDCCGSPQYDLQLDQTGNIHALAHATDNNEYFACCGDPIWSNDTSIATVSGYPPTWPFWATITAVAPGTTTINAQSWQPNDPYGGYGLFTALSPAQVTSGCGDARGNIIREYRTYSVPLTPACADFTQTRRTPIYFQFSEINTGDYAWALVRAPFIADLSTGYGLDKWRDVYGASRIINSSYRNPVRNAAVNGAFNPPSRHMFGDAADLRNQSYTEPEWSAMNSAAGTANADYIEPRDGPCGLGCVHADWRYHGGGYQ